MKKTLTITIALLLTALCFAGCGSVKTYRSESFFEVIGEDLWTAWYESFDGNKEHEVTLTGGGKHTFKVEIETNSGTFGLRITDSRGKSLYSGNELPPSSFAVSADGGGTYMIRIDAAEHNGRFNIEWE